VIDRRYGIAGAHPAPVLLQAIEQAWAERQPA
jgi:predicted DsbA family dithiol-disulfide isomerase